jgi:hypothetical protein
MSFVCEICKKCPNSHSFTKIKETNDEVFYYTCPSDATNNETEGIKYHFNGELSGIKEKKWIWTLDLKNFGIKDLFAINNFIEITKIVTEKYSKNLEKINIINQNLYTEIIFNLIKPILNERLRTIVNFSNDIKLSHDK